MDLDYKENERKKNWIKKEEKKTESKRRRDGIFIVVLKFLASKRENIDFIIIIEH